MSDLPHDRWWTATDLAAYMRLAPKTIANWASAKPDCLPPRIKNLHDLRWEPSVCIAWAKRQSEPERPAVAVGGRKRVR